MDEHVEIVQSMRAARRAAPDRPIRASGYAGYAEALLRYGVTSLPVGTARAQVGGRPPKRMTPADPRRPGVRRPRRAIENRRTLRFEVEQGHSNP